MVGLIGAKHFSRRSIEPPAADQHLARCTDKPSDLFMYRICSTTVFMTGPPFQPSIECETRSRGGTHLYRNIRTGQERIESVALMRLNEVTAGIRKTGSGLFW